MDIVIKCKIMFTYTYNQNPMATSFIVHPHDVITSIQVLLYIQHKKLTC